MSLPMHSYASSFFRENLTPNKLYLNLTIQGALWGILGVSFFAALMWADGRSPWVYLVPGYLMATWLAYRWAKKYAEHHIAVLYVQHNMAAYISIIGAILGERHIEWFTVEKVEKKWGGCRITFTDGHKIDVERRHWAQYKEMYETIEYAAEITETSKEKQSSLALA
jgi:hypothetical protein